MSLLSDQQGSESVHEMNLRTVPGDMAEIKKISIRTD